MRSATRWIPVTGLLAALAFALTGLISPPPLRAWLAACSVVMMRTSSVESRAA